MPAPRTPWKMTEVAFLREHYQAKGAVWCASQLGRTAPAVSRVARDAGLQRCAADIRHVATPAMLDVIRRAYQSGRNGAAGECARSLGKPQRWVSRQANAMGLSTRMDTYQPWTETEAEFVEERSHLTPDRIAKLMRKRGWKRTPAGVHQFMRRKGLKGANDRFMTAETVALCLGVHLSTVTKWIKGGLLLTERRGWNRTEAQNGDGYLIEDAELARTIVQNAALIDMRKVDGPWLIDLLARLGSRGLTDARDKGQRIVALKLADPDRSNTEIAAMVDSTPASVGVILARHRASAQREAA